MLLVGQYQQTESNDLGFEVAADSQMINRGIRPANVPLAPEERDCSEYPEPTKMEQFHNGGGSIWDNISVFRDFFLAAFSDGYQNGCFCGDGIPACCDSASRSGGASHKADDTTLRTARSTNSHDTTPSLRTSPSQEYRRRRKKPLAVAVGFKYAEDQNGRPIVVTPTGSRTSPIDLTGGAASVAAASSRQSPPRSPPSLPRMRSGGSAAGLPPILPRADHPVRISPVPVDSNKYSTNW